MSDYRTDLYNRYVTTFKIEDSHNQENLKSYWEWCEFKYSPLLKDLAPEAPILELGCGPGNMMGFLKQKGFSQIQGIDISEEQVQIAVGKGLDAKTGDVFEYLRPLENRFGAVLAIDFVEHFTKEELMRLVPLIHKSLKDDGLLIIQTPNGEGLFSGEIIYGDLTHSTVFTPRSLRQLLKLSGFTNFRFEETNPAPKNLVGKLRAAIWSGVKILVNIIRKAETGKSQDIWTENLICRCQKE